MQNLEIQKENQERQQLQEQIEQLETIAKQYMGAEAISRYGNLKAAHPEKAVQALIVISQLMQTGQAEMIDDTMLKKILRRLTPQKREFKIRRK